MKQGSGKTRSLALCALAALMALCAPAWAYKQDYLYEDSGSWRNVQTATDWNGKTYFTLFNSEGTMSYIYEVPEAFSGRREDLEKIEGKPFMTISGRAGIEITNDEAASYVYYTLAGDKTNLYRRALKRGDSGQPEVRDFTLEGSPFVFTGFTLAKDPDQILLMSRENAQREVTIGLFSFSNWNASGSNEPIRTWTCTLPEERNFKPHIAGQVGYHVVYEASTDRVWLVVWQTTDGTNYYKWFFHAPIGQGGALQAFDPEREVPGWNDTSNFKELSIGRYRRMVSFTAEEAPDRIFTAIGAYEVTTGGEMQLSDRVDSWVDAEGARRPLREFWGGGSGTVRIMDSSIDSLHDLYAFYSASASSGNESFVRVAHFAPDRPIQDPTPDQAEDGKPQPANGIVLRAAPFQGPEGYAATGSRWEVYQKTAKIQSASDVLSIRSYEDQEPVYVGRNTDGSSSHKMTQPLPAGDYVWRMAYDWRLGGEGGMFGSTRWSKLGSFTAVGSSTPTPNPTNPNPTPKPGPDSGKESSGGGCDAGLGGLALLLAASWVLKKKA